MHEDLRTDPLDPAAAEDAAMLRHWQQRLAPFAATRRAALREAPFERFACGAARPSGGLRVRAARIARRTLAFAAALALLLSGAHHYRLDWRDGRAWPVTREHAGTRAAATLAPGERLITAADESAHIAVARIGELALAPGSDVTLVETRRGRHRVDLHAGRVHARIWAPPGSFAIGGGAARFVDLGCEFELQRTPQGDGRLVVLSGWVQYTLAQQEVLVPAGYAIDFDAQRASLPLRSDADAGFAAAALALSALSGSPGPVRVQRAAQVAALATDADAYTLLQLLQQAPELADSALYPRLASALGVQQIDPVHRRRWRSGDSDAIDAWWQRLPRPPKQWWMHWRDAL